jgi:replication factor C subunit 2/4
LWNLGYAPIDIVGTLFRVTKTAEINERLKLSFVKVTSEEPMLDITWLTHSVVLQEIGFAHMRIADGCSTLLQLTGLISRLCQATVRLRAACPC